MEAQPLRGDPEPEPRPARYQSTAASTATATAAPADDHKDTKRSAKLSSAAASSEDDPWECNICLEPLKDTVCTLCGHLYCWPCLYRWLNTGHTTCPVCKAGVNKDNVIPIYTRGNDTDPRGRGVPERPPSQRPVPDRPAQQGQAFPGVPGMMQGHFGGLNFSAGVGFFPSLLGLQFQAFAAHGMGAAQNRPLTPEELAQLNTSRFLIILGSLVMVCLIFF